MAVNLVDQIRSYLTPDIMQRVSAYVGEPEGVTQKAMTGIVPTLVAALANQASSPGGPQQLAQILDTGKYDGSALSNLGSMLAGGVTTQNAVGAGKSILESLFGTRLGGVTDLIAQYAGARTGSASTLLALAVPLVLHVLGKQRAVTGSSPSALAALLGEQKSFLGGLLPAGLTSLLGWSGFGPDVTSGARTVRDYPREPAWEPAPPPSRRAATPWSWLVPLVILGALALAALAWWSSWQTPPTPPAARAPAGRATDVQLPGGGRVSLPEGSFNYSLYQWLASGDTTVPKRFVFDNLNFETGTTKLTPDSVPTIDSLTAILKAYSTAGFRLEGHTDNTGDPAANKKLSQDRADAIKALLVQGGIADSRINTAGFGAEKPVASNDTEDGRLKNRRTELVVENR
jgi:OmpA-OmpF porin, OOP family